MTDHKLGQPRTGAAWFRDSKLQAKDQVRAAFGHDTQTKGVLFSDIVWEVKSPNDPDVPTPPEPGLRLMVGTAKVIGFKEVEDDDELGRILGIRHTKQGAKPIRSFFGDLCDRDKERLIFWTRACYARDNPGKPPLPIKRCVEYIEMIGPHVWEKELRRAVDAGEA